MEDFKRWLGTKQQLKPGELGQQPALNKLKTTRARLASVLSACANRTSCRIAASTTAPQPKTTFWHNAPAGRTTLRFAPSDFVARNKNHRSFAFAATPYRVADGFLKSIEDDWVPFSPALNFPHRPNTFSICSGLQRATCRTTFHPEKNRDPLFSCTSSIQVRNLTMEHQKPPICGVICPGGVFRNEAIFPTARESSTRSNEATFTSTPYEGVSLPTTWQFAAYFAKARSTANRLVIILTDNLGISLSFTGFLRPKWTRRQL